VLGLENGSIGFHASEEQQSCLEFSHPYDSDVLQIGGMCSFEYCVGMVWIAVIVDGMARQLWELRLIEAASVRHW
jgi:hypothetical protein